MSIVKKLIAGCHLDGESFLYIFYDDVTLDILRFEVKGNTKRKLSLTFEEPDLKEKLSLLGEREQGEKIQIIETKKSWKMREVIEDGEKVLKYPPHMKVSASWEAV